jgi:hypothetical protein
MTENQQRRFNNFSVLLIFYLILKFTVTISIEYFGEEEFDCLKHEGVQLLDEFKSCQSEKAFREVFGRKGYEIIFDHEEKWTRNKRFYQKYQVRIENYGYLGETGILRLHFFNDQLYMVNFKTKKINKVIKLMQEKRGIEFDSNKHFRGHPNTEIWLGSRDIYWEDSRFFSQLFDSHSG